MNRKAMQIFREHVVELETALSEIEQMNADDLKCSDEILDFVQDMHDRYYDLKCSKGISMNDNSKPCPSHYYHPGKYVYDVDFLVNQILAGRAFNPEDIKVEHWHEQVWTVNDIASRDKIEACVFAKPVKANAKFVTLEVLGNFDAIKGRRHMTMNYFRRHYSTGCAFLTRS